MSTSPAIRGMTDQLNEISEMNGWSSPLLGIRFKLTGNNLEIYGPDGRPFLTYQEIADERDRAEKDRDRVALERDQIALDRGQVALERDRVAIERNQIAHERDIERQRAERMAARLRAMGIDPIE